MSPVRERADRRWDRTATAVAGIWCVVLAGVTLLPYQAWLTGSGYEVLEGADALGGAAAVSEVAGVVRVYGSVLLLGGVITCVLAHRLGTPAPRAVVAWLAACTAAALTTRDVVGVLLFSIALTVVLARARAHRLATRRTAPRVRERPVGRASGPAPSREDVPCSATTSTPGRAARAH